MTNETSFQHACLEPLLRHFQSKDIVAQLLEPTETFDYYTLCVRFSNLGTADHDVQFELTLPPGMVEMVGGTYALQLNGTLIETVEAEAVNGLVWMANRLNTRIGVGAFVVLERERQLLFRQTVVLNRAFPPMLQAGFVDVHFSMILHQLQLFIDALLDVASGRVEAKAALRKHPMADMFGLDTPS